MIQLPGLIDPHVHLRTPGQEYKEDFLTGTSAALAGGFTTVIDMPNNLTPITTNERLHEKINIATQQIVSDIGFYFGTLGDNLDQFPLIQNHVLGLKVYLNQTTGGFIVDTNKFQEICEAWPIGKPILVHAEEDVLEATIETAHTTGQRLHIAHVSSQNELQTILNAKMKGYKLTCGVTPHHLFLTKVNMQQLGNFGLVKPSLKSQNDQDFLWQHLQDIDVIESDHAPHTIKEKQGNNPPYGLPNLETTLPLLLTAAHKSRLTLEDIKRLCHDGPKNIFLHNVIASEAKQSHSIVIPAKAGIQENKEWIPDPFGELRVKQVRDDETTYIKIDENEEWTIENGKLFTKSNWSPYNGWKVKGRVKKVVIRDTIAFENGKILVNPGFGHVL